MVSEIIKEKATEVIRVTPSNHTVLKKLKKIDEEPYHKVVDRLILFYLENNDDLSEEFVKELEIRVDSVDSGEVYSSDEMRKKLFGNEE